MNETAITWIITSLVILTVFGVGTLYWIFDKFWILEYDYRILKTSQGRNQFRVDNVEEELKELREFLGVIYQEQSSRMLIKGKRK